MPYESHDHEDLFVEHHDLYHSWGQFSDNCINSYAKAKKNNLENGAIICNNVNYTNDAQISAINVLYDDVIELMPNASDELVSQQGDKARLYQCRPGWNGHATYLHTASRECFVMWVDAHKPKNGPVF